MPHHHEADAIVVGGGVVGLASALALARARARVVVLERHPRAGMEGPSRNSGVLHAGIHHPAAWLKTRLCVRGRELLVDRCRRFGIPWARTGKLVVATEDAELPRLEALAARAAENGAGPVRLLSAEDVRRAEPAVRARAALEVDSTAVVRTPALVRSLDAEAHALGVEVRVGLDVVALERDGAGAWIACADGAPRFRASTLVVAAGLGSDRVAALAGLDVDALGLRQHFCKGQWMALSERWRKAVRRLVYPLPDARGHGLGIHLTRDVDGFLLAGPDVEWTATPDTSLDDGRRGTFAEAARRYLPGLDADDLHPLAAGVRPKLGGPDAPPRDFAVADAALHGAAGLVVLAGIESPGLTASLALGEEVAQRVGAAR